MLNRASRRFVAVLVIALGVGLLTGPAANASLQKYKISYSTLSHFFSTSPKAQYLSSADAGPGLIDESGPNPILRKLVYGNAPGTSGGITIIVPELSGGFIFLNGFGLEGPGPDQTGTGSTASSIDWGNTIGWTITGGNFCHSIPSYVCNLAQRADLATVPAPLISTNFDSGTWVFHGTGFTSAGFITFTSTTKPGTPGNANTWLRGHADNDGTVPAIPLLGIGAIGVSVIAMGIATARRQR